MAANYGFSPEVERFAAENPLRPDRGSATGRAALEGRPIHIPDVFGKYEADIEAWLLFNLAIRHTEGVIALARHDLILLPPAQMAARAGFEAAVKAAWLVDADDPFDREARWLAHLSFQERYLSRSANELSEAEQNATVSPQVREVRLARAEQLRKREASVRDFRL
jgi:hypothetical protein